MIAADRHRVEVSHVLGDEVLLDVSHHPQRELGGEDAGVLGLVFFQDVGLDRPSHPGKGLRLDPLVDLGGEHLVAGDTEKTEAQPVVALG